MTPWTMNDAETWDALATGIERKRRIGPTWYDRWGSERSALGLCWAIQELGRHAGCPDDRRIRLLSAVSRYAPHNRHSWYYWPLTPKGDRARARFCRRMAQLARLAEVEAENARLTGEVEAAERRGAERAAGVCDDDAARARRFEEQSQYEERYRAAGMAEALEDAAQAIRALFPRADDPGAYDV